MEVDNIRKKLHNQLANLNYRVTIVVVEFPTFRFTFQAKAVMIDNTANTETRETLPLSTQTPPHTLLVYVRGVYVYTQRHESLSFK